MDVDDVDGRLAQAFGCMGTVDKEVLVRQFQQILGPDHQLPSDSCAFFLDMNNWNLQAALGSYYDLGNSNSTNGRPPLELFAAPPAMMFVQDVTVGEGESVPPATTFTKTWRLRNTGAHPWPDGCTLRHIEGRLLADAERAAAPPLAAGHEADVSVQMSSPADAGVYQSRWQLFTPAGMPFGEMIWCIVVVEQSGLLGITQQLASSSCGAARPADEPPAAAHQDNPFSRPYNRSAVFDTSREDGESASMDESLLAVRGSPAPFAVADFDPPASPNGSSALHEAVVACLPQQARLHAYTASNNEYISAPMDIPHRFGFGRTPEAPPCTPSTPPSAELRPPPPVADQNMQS